MILTTNIWNRQYSDPSNLDPFSGENHETYRSVTGFNISLFEGTVHTCGSKLQTLGMRYPFTLPVCRPISHRNGWSFRVYISCYMIPLRDFVPDVVNSRRGDSRRHDILWWYHVNKYRAMRGNRSELAPGRKSPRWHVNTHVASSCESAMTHFDFDLFIPEHWTFKTKGMFQCTLITYHRILLCDFVYIDRRASFNKSVRLFEWCVPCRWTQLKHNGSGISVPYDAHGPGSLFS